MADSAAERTEQATPKRLQEARKKGQVPRSVDLSTAAVCIAAAVAIYSLGRMAAGQFADFMQDSLSMRPAMAMSEEAIWPALTMAGGRALWIILPILAATFCAALAAPIAIGGWNFSGQALMPQFSRLNPVTGLGRVSGRLGRVGSRRIGVARDLGECGSGGKGAGRGQRDERSLGGAAHRRLS